MKVKTTSVVKVPNLRFSEFEGEWVEKKLGEIANFSKGKGISKSDIANDGLLECVRYGQLYTDYSEVIDEIVSKTNIDKNNLVLSESGDVIIPASGETQIDIATASCVLKSGVALGGDLNIIKTSINGVFLSYYLNNTKKFDIARLSQGISVVHLYASQLKTLKLNVPSQEEQQKIAKFLTVIDERISIQIEIIEDYEEIKKGMMQQLFSQQLRFKDNNGADFPDWIEKTLDGYCSFFSGGTPISTTKRYYKGNIPFIGSGNISQDSVASYISEEALKNSSAKLVEKGDVLYALYGATSGEVSISKISGAINQAVLCIRTKEIDSYLLFQVLKMNKEKITSKYLQGGQGNLSAKIIRNLKFLIPSSKKEQP